MIKKVIIPLIIIGIAGVWIYQYLGGFDKILFNKTTISLNFHGNEYIGLYNNPETENLFLKARDIALKNPNADLAIISYPSAKDSLHQIIGVVLEGKADLAEMDYTEELKGEYLAATITAHNLVMPKPNEVLDRAQKYASENNLSIDPQRSIDIYQGDRSLRVLIPLVD